MFNPKLYREACRELRAPEDKIEEVIAMTENTNKKIRRPLRTALICAAALAMMVVGVSAANPGMVEAVAGRMADIVQITKYRMELTTEDGSTMTVFSAPPVTVENRDGQAILVIDGEDIGDITDELNTKGLYRYEGVAGESPLTVTVEGTAEKWTASVSVGDPDGLVYSCTNNYEGSGLSNSSAIFSDSLDNVDVDVFVSVSGDDSEILGNANDIIPKYKAEISKVIPEK